MNGWIVSTSWTTKASRHTGPWYSKLKNEFVLLPEEYKGCKKVFEESGMRTFADWLENYNNLDIVPFLEAMEKMRRFYSRLGVDIFKEAVPLPGVSSQYLLPGTLKGKGGPQLYTPNEEAYKKLKEAVVGGLSLVFTRKHRKRVKRRSARTRTKMLAYVGGCSDSMWTPCTQAPCCTPCRVDQERWCTMRSSSKQPVGLIPTVVQNMVSLSGGGHQRPKEAVEKLWGIAATIQQPLPRQSRSTWKSIWSALADPRAKPKSSVGSLPGRSCSSSRFCNGVWSTAWRSRPCIELSTTWFVDEVNQRRVDEDPDKALLAEVFKLLGNSAYGKLIEAKERQTRVINTKDQSVVNKAQRSVWFDNMFKLAFRKGKVKINLPFQVGIYWRSVVAISEVGVPEVLFYQLFAFALRFDPVKKLHSFFLVFGISGLVSLKSFVVFSFS